MKTEKEYIDYIVRQALDEDIPSQDITTRLLLQENPATAVLLSKDIGIFYGEVILESVFESIDTSVIRHQFKHDGDIVRPGDKIAEFKGAIAALLKAERVMLNFVQRLSGISTVTKQFVETLNNPLIKVMDTRKTTPNMRLLEKNAVLAGGGANHRFGLSDMILIKENHLAQLAKENRIQDLPLLLSTFKQANPKTKIEIEIETPDQLEQLDLRFVDIVMLDNFSMANIHKALDIYKEHHFTFELEVSGNITLDTIAQYRELDIHRISVGSLTHSVRALDLSLLIQ